MVSMAENAKAISKNSVVRVIPLNEDNFKLLFNEYYANLCQYAIRIVRRSEIAEEIVQDQFIYLWNNRGRLEIHSSYQSYLFKSVRNKCIDFLRSRFAKVNQNDDSELLNYASGDDPSSEIENEELNQLVGKAVLELPEKCHTIFTMSRFGDMKNQEIADALNISIKTVENQITIALKKIKNFLDKNWLLLMAWFTICIEKN
jgi:RNA polymerase sigma-70 factor (ECF subfamily)